MPDPIMPDDKKPGLLSADNPKSAQPPKGKADPKLQQQYDMFMANGMNIIHSQKFSDTLAKAMSTVKDQGKIIDLIANATLNVIIAVEDSAGQKGIKFPANMLIMLGNQLMGQVIAIYTIVTKKKLTEEQKGQAFSLAVSLYLDQAVKSGKLTPQQVQEIAAQMSKSPVGQKVAKRIDATHKQGKFLQKVPPPRPEPQPQGQPPPQAGGGMPPPRQVPAPQPGQQNPAMMNKPQGLLATGGA
jgi:hypothetical protein